MKDNYNLKYEINIILKNGYYFWDGIENQKGLYDFDYVFHIENKENKVIKIYKNSKITSKEDFMKENIILLYKNIREDKINKII